METTIAIIFACGILFGLAAILNYAMAFDRLGRADAESQLTGYSHLGTGVVWTVAALVFAFGFLILTNPG